MVWSNAAWCHDAHDQGNYWGGSRVTGNTGFSRPRASADAGGLSWQSTPSSASSLRCCENYDRFSILGGTSAKALPLFERARLIEFMMPSVRKLRLAALNSNELDAIIYLATGQQPSLRAYPSVTEISLVRASCVPSTWVYCVARPHNNIAFISAF